MPEISQSKTTATCYPPKSLYNNWCEHAQNLDMSTSAFIIRMVETGRKNIRMNDGAVESIRNIRQQLTDLQQELERQRERNRDLERQLEHTIHPEIISYVEENPGATTPRIIQHIADTVPARVVGHLEALEESTLQIDDGEYYISESDA